MQPKLLAFLLIISLGSGCVIDAQETSPTASPSPAKHRSHKKGAETAATSPAAEASASPAAEAGAAASPAGKKHGRKPKAATPEASPAATAAETANEGATRTTPEPGSGHGVVWVNTVTHIYHKEGSRFYGKTKKGKYITEAEAIKEGDKEAKGGMKAKPQ
jgi:hypothetical protein